MAVRGLGAAPGMSFPLLPGPGSISSRLGSRSGGLVRSHASTFDRCLPRARACLCVPCGLQLCARVPCVSARGACRRSIGCAPAGVRGWLPGTLQCAHVAPCKSGVLWPCHLLPVQRALASPRLAYPRLSGRVRTRSSLGQSRRGWWGTPPFASQAEARTRKRQSQPLQAHWTYYSSCRGHVIWRCLRYRVVDCLWIMPVLVLLKGMSTLWQFLKMPSLLLP